LTGVGTVPASATMVSYIRLKRGGGKLLPYVIRGLVLFVPCLVLFSIQPARAVSPVQTLHVPMTVDYPLIRALLVNQLYTQPGDRAIFVDKDTGCARVELWSPEVSPQGSLVKVSSKIKIFAGIPVLGKCALPIEWEGFIEVFQRVWLDPEEWRLRFKAEDFQAYNQQGEKTILARIISDLVKSQVYPHLDQMSVDLAPPVKDLKAILPGLFTPEERQRIEHWLETVRLGTVQVGPDAVGIDLIMEVETLPETPAGPVPELSAQEIERSTAAWEAWDAFAVYLMEALVQSPLSEEERTTVFETLLEMRYQFVQALTEKTVGRDLVREQFVRAWQRITPFLRKYLVRQPSRPPLSYLAFFTAGDALVTLDKLGPSLGVDISRDGLLRLVRLLAQGEAGPLLDYSYAVDPKLRELMGFGPPLDESGPAFDVQELNIPEEPEQGEGPGHQEKKKVPANEGFFRKFQLPSAFAGEAQIPSLAEIRRWVPSKKNIGSYVDDIRQILERTAAKIFSKSRLDATYQPFFRNLVLATAWQESCWRQFVKSRGKVRYILSYNNSSVGLMQVNERIWRGIYRVQSLRWNIRYNASAGAEILHRYLRTYSLKGMKSQKHMDMDTLARCTYAIYNGGPGELQRFLRRNQKKRYYQSDELFWQKYVLTKDGRLEEVAVCLQGKKAKPQN
jgi:hypothetical protein